MSRRKFPARVGPPLESAQSCPPDQLRFTLRPFNLCPARYFAPLLLGLFATEKLHGQTSLPFGCHPRSIRYCEYVHDYLRH